MLMASDRELTLSLVQLHIEALGCAFVTGPKQREEHSRREEHGAHVGVSAMRDVFMLSLADAFIGTTGSTFSLLAANLLSASRDPGTHGPRISRSRLTFCSMLRTYSFDSCRPLHPAQTVGEQHDAPTLLVKPSFMGKARMLNESAFCAAYGVQPAILGKEPAFHSPAWVRGGGDE